MTATPAHPDIDAALRLLQANADAVGWPQRRALVQAVADQLARVGPTESAVSLLLILADDPKWEVRKDVADCLHLLPDDRFPQLATRLADDSNAFVRQAAERALDRRRRGERTAKQKRRGLDHIQDEYDAIERLHGNLAAERSRRLAERLYDVLVGATVHDMRNILAPLKSQIASVLGGLDDGKIDKKRLGESLAKMSRQAEMLERLMEDMRSYAQPTPAERRRERLADVVAEAHGMVLDVFKATGRDASVITAQVDVPENLTVEVSRHQIVRAIGNVIKNAYESFAEDPQTFRPGKICVTARSVGDERIEIVVIDNGMGLSCEELADVRRFVPGGTSKKTHGTGFGLPLAKRKIEDHGGSLAVDSVEDSGTTVTITLPIESEGGNE